MKSIGLLLAALAVVVEAGRPGAGQNSVPLKAEAAGLRSGAIVKGG
jgi:hypothetical protein